MARFGAMLPVSDGVFQGSNPGDDDGLSWVVGENIDAWPQTCPLGDPPSVLDSQYPNVRVCPGDEMLDSILQEAEKQNSMGTRIDITVAWRLRDPTRIPPPGGEPCGGVGECCGGNAPSVNPSPERRFASVCGGTKNGVENTAPIIAQEVAHNFGIVSKESPHFDGDYHSKDLQLVDPFAFDFHHLRPYSAAPPGPWGSYLGDVMSDAWSQGKDLTLYNAYDWEHLRKRLVELSNQALDESEGQKKLVEEVQAAFLGLQKIHVEDPEPTLNLRPGFEWHWTRIGFQPLIEGKIKRNESGLALSAESVLFALRELGVKEVYAPIDEKSLGFIISQGRHNSMRCKIGNVGHFNALSLV